MTSISATAQMLLAEKVQQERRERSQNDADTGDDVDPDTDVNAASLDETTEFEMGSKASADAVRQEFSEYLSEEDDARMTWVRMAEGTPGEVVKELKRRSES